MTSAPHAGPAADPTSAPRPPAPFLGIEPFGYSDRGIFFAREEEKYDLLRRVTLYRGVLLYGESGTGKSSLVNAGFIPAAIADGLTPERLRLQPRDGEEFIVERIPETGGDAGPYLRSNFADGAAPRAVLSTEGFMDSLKRLPAGEHAFLIFDQFEEFITLFEEAPLGPAVEEARRCQERVLAALVEILRDGALPAKILLVFREDYLAKMGRLFALCPDLPDQHLRLRPPGVAALAKIIRGPFDAFPGQFGTELAPGLAAALAREFSARSESGYVNLSEVQIACLKLWKSGDPEHFFKEKKVEGLLEEHLSEAIDRLGPVLRDPALAILTHLVSPEGTRNVVSKGDLMSMVEREETYSPARRETALQALERDGGLLRHELRRETHYYELVSEFLIPKIRQEKETRARRIARAERRKKLVAYALAAVCLALLLLSFFLYRRDILRDKVVEDLRLQNNQLRRGKTDEQRLAWEKLFGIYASESEAKAVTTPAELLALLRSAREENPSTNPLKRRDTRRRLEISHSAMNFSPEVIQLWRAMGFKVNEGGYDPEYKGDGPRLQTIIYDPSRATTEDVREVALGMAYAGHAVRLILRVEGQGYHLRAVNDERSRECPEMAVEKIADAPDFGARPDAFGEVDQFRRCGLFSRTQPGVATPAPRPR